MQSLNKNQFKVGQGHFFGACPYLYEILAFEI
jgi:hypothetical protein